MRATTAGFETLRAYEATARHEALRERWGRAAHFARNVLLFAAAPFIGLAYAMAFPFVGFAVLVWVAVRAARERPAA